MSKLKRSSFPLWKRLLSIVLSVAILLPNVGLVLAGTLNDDFQPDAAYILSAGGFHSAIVRNNGQIFTWGLDSHGQLGRGIDEETPARGLAAIPGTDWVTVSAGDFHTMAIRADGTLWAWGSNNHGQLGLGTAFTPDRTGTPQQVGTSTDWAYVAAGANHTLAITRGGNLYAWGANYVGQLGDGTTTARRSPTQIGPTGVWRSITAGYAFSLAIRNDRSLWAWGHNTSGQLGVGNNTNRLTPTAVRIDNSRARSWESVSAGGHHAIAVQTDSTIWAWGMNTSGQLGDGSLVNRNVPTRISVFSDWVSVAAGNYHTVATRRVPVGVGTGNFWHNHTLWAWGNLEADDPGRGSDLINIPRQVGDQTNWYRAAAGGIALNQRYGVEPPPPAGAPGGHSIANRSDGSLFFWGNSESFQSGSATENTNTPVLLQLPSLQGFIPVREIRNVPTTGRPGEYLNLSATVWPTYATVRRIVWTLDPVQAAVGGAPDAEITETPGGFRLFTSGPGRVYVRATIAGGGENRTPVVERFAIEIHAGGYRDITSSFTCDNFLTALRQDVLSLPPNSRIMDAHVANITRLELPGREISSLSGIEHFTELRELHVQNNRLTQLDLRQNRHLSFVNASNNLLFTFGDNRILLRADSTHIDNFILTNNFLREYVGTDVGDLFTPAVNIHEDAVIGLGHNDQQRQIPIPVITTAELAGVVSVPFSRQLNFSWLHPTYVINEDGDFLALNDYWPYEWRLVSGALPYGLSLAQNGVISGVPSRVSAEEGFIFSVEVSGLGGRVTTSPQEFSMIVSEGGPAHVPVTSINLDTTFGRVNMPFSLNDVARIYPIHPENERRIAEGLTPIEPPPIIWQLLPDSKRPTYMNFMEDLQNGVSIPGMTHPQDGIILHGVFTPDHEGTLRVRAIIVGGLSPDTSHGSPLNFYQDFTITISAASIRATVEGLETMFINTPVNARVIYTLEGTTFTDRIFPEDFAISGLPPGLEAAPAVRISDTQVAVHITGAPSIVVEHDFTINLPRSIPIRNIRGIGLPVGVSPHQLLISEIPDSAVVLPTTARFDLNQIGALHRNITVILDQRFQYLRSINYGRVVLREGHDYIRNDDRSVTFLLPFLTRLPVGEWDVTFIMRQGANPVLTIEVIDTRIPEPRPPLEPIDPPPTPPTAPPHPDENFFFLSGGRAVGVDSLAWDRDRARVSPVIVDNTATVTVRAHTLDYMAWSRPGEFFEVNTRMARLRVPTDILDIIDGARAYIAVRGLDYSEVNLRITLTEQRNTAAAMTSVRAVFPNGQILSPVVEITMELSERRSENVFFTAREFTRPLDTTFVMMNRASHVRPAGVFFNAGRVEFAPFRNFSPNEITVRSIFAGVHSVIHNGTIFQDLPFQRAHWGFAEAYTAAYSGLVVALGNLDADAPLTRGEFLQLLSVTLQLPRLGIGSSGFSDVSGTHPLFEGISRAHAAGYTGIWRGATLNPTAIVSRQEMAAVVGAIAFLRVPHELRPSMPMAQFFVDGASIHQDLLPYVQMAFDYRIMIGWPERHFRPERHASRVEGLTVAVNLARLFGLLDYAEQN